MKISSGNEIGAFEAKNTLGSLLDRVERGEEIVITRHGKAVARLVPADGRIDRSQVQAAYDRIRERARQLHRSGASENDFDWETLKKLRDEGRP
ncbi:MAG: type II toxin-antitoxin system prevent-host-death family antitoxin [Candidatus Sulfotelmatobacter sp.]